jgi:ankyrin repeat protein
MRAFWVFLVAIFLGNSTSSQEQIDMADIRTFFSLVETGSVSAVEASLIENPALATGTDTFGFQPIHVLDYRDFEEKLDLLIQYGADINAQNAEGVGLLHILIDTEFLPTVLVAGADSELKDRSGRTPVMTHLTEPEGLEMVAALLQAGASPNATDNNGQSVLDYARIWNNPQVTELVIDAGGATAN